MRWRWDQGRLDYFKFDNIVTIAKVLHEYEGLSLDGKDDLLRIPLERATGLPFAPSHYKVWRNYARTFHCAMLATCVSKRLVTTDLCRRLTESSESFSSDEYFNFVFSRFALPFPAFDDYKGEVPPSFPFVAIIKFLMTDYGKGRSLQDVFKYVVGNNCTGFENQEYYKNLRPTSRIPQGDEKRQVREMLVFMGQSSYLKWFDQHIYIDSSDYDAILKAVSSFVTERRKKNAAEEFLTSTSLDGDSISSKFDITLKDRNVAEFAIREGGKVFRSHGKIERSPLVRRKFFEMHPEIVCDACSLHTQERYPWTENLLELHHILPLAATLNINGTTTVLDDIIPLCPSCHKSIHLYYTIKLREWDVVDFGSKKMARDVYEMAKGAICL